MASAALSGVIPKGQANSASLLLRTIRIIFTSDFPPGLEPKSEGSDSGAINSAVKVRVGPGRGEYGGGRRVVRRRGGCFPQKGSKGRVISAGWGVEGVFSW
jgi:hypothetical protein